MSALNRSFVAFMVLGMSLVGRPMPTTTQPVSATSTAGASSAAQFPRLAITPRRPTENDPIVLRTFFGEAVPCDTVTTSVARTETTITVEAIVNRYQGACILTAVPLFGTSHLEPLPEGHYVVEVYRTEQPSPNQRQLWATGEFDVVKDPTFIESEPNHSQFLANEVIPNVEITGIFDEPNDRDLYRVEAEWGERLTIDVEAERLNPPSSADPVISVLDARGVTRAINDNLGASLDPLLDIPVDGSGTYWVTVRDRRGVSGPEARYRLHITATRAFSEREPNGSFRRPNYFWLEPTIFGDLNTARDVDIFRFWAQEGEMIELNVDARSLPRPSDASVIITLFDEHERVIMESRGDNQSPDPWLRLRAPYSGEYYFRLRNAVIGSSTNFRYDVTLRINEEKKIE
jgi:hypothetical protein